MKMTFEFKPKLTRADFEKLFGGEWKSENGDRFRKNGDMITRVLDDGRRLWRNKNFAVTGKSWYELADAMKILPRYWKEEDES